MPFTMMFVGSSIAGYGALLVSHGTEFGALEVAVGVFMAVIGAAMSRRGDGR